MNQVFLGLGSNLGPSEKMVLSALQKISELKYVHNLKKSSLYLTSPISDLEQNDFVNAVCHFNCKLDDVEKLLQDLEQIEKKLGKKEKPKNAPRIIDIDILLFKDQFFKNDYLEVPHNKMLERLFVLVPLFELQPKILYPISKNEKIEMDLKEFLNQFDYSDNEFVKKLSVVN